MLQLAWFILCSYGLTYLVVYASIFNSVRPSKEWLGGFGKLFHCPLCFGFHAGWFLFLLSPYTELFSFDQSVTNFLICGWTSAGTSAGSSTTVATAITTVWPSPTTRSSSPVSTSIPRRSSTSAVLFPKN